jgi:high-affinity nickel-transport protein
LVLIAYVGRHALAFTNGHPVAGLVAANLAAWGWGAMMVGAYGWAFVNPIRKLWYNLTITAASVLGAVLIGGLDALGLLADQLGLEGWFWSAIGPLNEDLGSFGFVVIGIFAFCWIASAAIYRWRGYGDAKIESV